MILHQRTHPDLDVADCFGCKAASLRIAPSAAGSGEARAKNAQEASWQSDHAAYRRLRANGVQPPKIDGSARLEARADHPIEVEHGITGVKDFAAKAQDAKDMVTA